MTGILVGRTAELEQIAALLGSDEGTAAAVVLGDPGVGKSRLLAEVARDTDLPTFRVVGYESERLVPLAAASELLRELISAGEHGALLDELAFGSSAGTAPVRLFEAAHRALESVGRALLLVDDLQWADDLSLALVHYLLRSASASERPLRLLAAGRSVARSIGFAEEVERLVAPSRAALIDLRPLDPEASLELVLSIDARLTREQALLVCERSAGFPFWIETLARSREPVDTRRLLTGRLRDAGVDAGALLALLAVVARPLAVDDAAELLEWPSERLEAAAEDLVSRGVARRLGSGVTVAHDLLRAAAYEDVGEWRRRELHRRAADWLERAAEDDLPLLREALQHRTAAGERPFGLAARLVASPQRRRLGSEGLSTLAAVADEADLSTPDGQTLYAGVASLALELGEHRLALERWAAFAPRAADADVRFEALLGASKAAFGLGWEYARQAHELVAEALTCATTAEQVVAARAHEARILLWLEHRTADGAAIAREALTRSRGLGTKPRQRRVRLQALQTMREAAMQEADGEEILRLAEEMVALTRGWDEDAHAEALLARADGLARTGPLGEAEASARAALELATRRVLPLHAAEAALFLATVLYEPGRLDAADEVTATAQQLTARVEGVRPTRLIAHELTLLRGEIERELSEFAAAVERRPDPHVRIIPRHFVANLLSRASGTAARAEVAALLRAAREDAVAARCPRCRTELHLYAAAALTRVGCAEEAEADLAQAEAVPPRDAINRYLRLYARALVTAAREPRAGAALLEAVCAEAERLDRRLELLWARIDLARALMPADRQRAAELLRDAAGAADSIGATAPRLVAEQELRRLRVRTWRRGPSRGVNRALSEREREVAELVAKGASNPEIAQTLFLSRKTVERHVSNALAKLGVRNRAQLAALLSREREGVPR